MSQESEPSTSSEHPLDSEVNDRVALLARGEWLLKRLAKEAEAARAEARHADLQRLLADARRGDEGELKIWLHRHDRVSAGPEEVPYTENRSVDTRSVNLEQPVSEQPRKESEQSTWDDFLPASRQRLLARARRLQAGDGVSQVVAAATPADPMPRDDKPGASKLSASKQSASKQSVSKLGPDELGDNKSGASLLGRGKQLRADKPLTGGADETSVCKEPSKSRLHSDSSRPTQSSIKSFPSSGLAARKESLDATEIEQQGPHKKTLLFFRVGGLSASILLHIVIVIVLAVLTIKLPAPPAGLAFEASDVSNETFELTEQVEVAQPEQPDTAVPTPEMQIDISQDLASISDMTNALSKNVPSQAAGLASAAMMASSSAGGSNAMNTNSSFFGAAAAGNCFCYVIDSSSSMKGGPWEAAKAELLRSLASMKAKQRFYIIFFNQDLDAIPMPGEREPAKRALYATPENIEHARRWVDTIRIAKGAPPADAMELAVNLEPDAIYLLTDGATKTDLAGFLRDKNRIADLINGEQVRVPIHAIAFYSLAGQELMRRVALENSGQFIYVPDPSKN